MNSKRLSATEKTAVILMALGEEVAAEIFKNMNENEIRRISGAISRLGRVEQSVVDAVMEEFHQLLETKTTHLSGGAGLAEKMLRKAFPGQEGEEMVHQVVESPAARLESADLVDGPTLARLIRHEHPQTMTLVLAHLKPEKGAATLRALPEALRSDLMQRLAGLGPVAPELVEEIDDHLRQQINEMGWAGQANRPGGPEAVARILNSMESARSSELLDGLQDRDPDLEGKVRDLMFVFDDLAGLSDRHMQELLKATGMDIWGKALRSAAAAVTETVYRNMSERAATRLQEDMAAAAPMKVSDVEEARKEILHTARRLEEEGKIVLKQDKDEYV